MLGQVIFPYFVILFVIGRTMGQGKENLKLQTAVLASLQCHL